MREGKISLAASIDPLESLKAKVTDAQGAFIAGSFFS